VRSLSDRRSLCGKSLAAEAAILRPGLRFGIAHEKILDVVGEPVIWTSGNDGIGGRRVVAFGRRHVGHVEGISIAALQHGDAAPMRIACIERRHATGIIGETFLGILNARGRFQERARIHGLRELAQAGRGLHRHNLELALGIDLARIEIEGLGVRDVDALRFSRRIQDRATSYRHPKKRGGLLVHDFPPDLTGPSIASASPATQTRNRLIYFHLSNVPQIRPPARRPRQACRQWTIARKSPILSGL